MINLLPPKQADAIKYGRQNTLLRQWLIGIAAATAVLIIILAGGWFYLNKQSSDLNRNISITEQQLKDQNLAQVQKDAKELTGDINVINKVLSQEIHFSDLIQAIGQDMPSGTVLGSLSLSKVSGSLDLTASATDYASAAQIAANLSDPKNGIFSKVDVIDVSCSSVPGPVYRCNTTLKALFAPTAKTKFLSVPKEGGS